MVERNTFALSFVTANNGSISINIPRADKSLLAGEIEQNMQNLINLAIILCPSMGRPVQINGADMVTTAIEKII